MIIKNVPLPLLLSKGGFWEGLNTNNFLKIHMISLKDLIKNKSSRELDETLKKPFVLNPSDMPIILELGNNQREISKFHFDYSAESFIFFNYLLNQMQNKEIPEKEIDIIKNATPEFKEYFKFCNKKSENGKSLLEDYSLKIVEKISLLLNSPHKRIIKENLTDTETHITYCIESSAKELLKKSGDYKDFTQGILDFDKPESHKALDMLHYLKGANMNLYHPINKIMNN